MILVAAGESKRQRANLFILIGMFFLLVFVDGFSVPAIMLRSIAQGPTAKL